MKKFWVVAIIAVLLLLISDVVLFWRHGPTGTTTFQLSGSGSFTGYYVREGQRVAVSNALPWSFDCPKVTAFEFRKVQPEATLTFTAHYDEIGGAHAMLSSRVPPGVLGIRGRVQNHGLSTRNFNQ
jgi:hypothetical protein